MTGTPDLNPTGAVFITGATSGLGRQVALRLAATGRAVVVAGRRREAVEELVSTINASGGRATDFVADLADLGAVRQALRETPNPPLHGIVANAGITTDDIATTSTDGFDLTFAVNVLAHQLLFHELVPLLLPGSRIVIMSSGVHHPGNTLARRLRIPLPRWVGTEKLARQQQQTDEGFIDSGRCRYSTSKLANVYQARELQRRLDFSELNADVFALDPGLMIDTDLAREAPAPARFLLRNLGRAMTPLVGNMRLSTTTAGYVQELVESPVWAGRGFSYIDGNEREPLGELALRDDNAEELWETATELVGIAKPDPYLAASTSR